MTKTALLVVFLQYVFFSFFSFSSTNDYLHIESLPAHMDYNDRQQPAHSSCLDDDDDGQMMTEPATGLVYSILWYVFFSFYY